MSGEASFEDLLLLWESRGIELTGLLRGEQTQGGHYVPPAKWRATAMVTGRIKQTPTGPQVPLAFGWGASPSEAFLAAASDLLSQLTPKKELSLEDLDL